MTMSNEPRALREIHEIREKIFERTKGLSYSEYNKLVNKEVDELCKKYNFHPNWTSKN